MSGLFGLIQSFLWRVSEKFEMMILLITIFVTILIQVAGGEKCINNRNTTYIVIYNCNGVSYQNLAPDFQTEKITKFNASFRNNEFPKIDQKMFRNMTGLIELWLADCKIEKIDENAFANLKVLSALSLRVNQIKSLHVNTFSNLGNLKELYLLGNQIKELPAKLFEKNINLRFLDLQQNEITELPAGLFETLPGLVLLAINENQLKVIHGSTFLNNKKLRKLYLGFNKIEAVAPGTFDELTKLIGLYLRNNICIDTFYVDNTSNKTIDLTQVSSDLSACYANYENNSEPVFEATTNFKDSLDCDRHTSSDVSATPMLTIYASTVTILVIIAIIIIIILIAKDKNVDQNSFEMERRNDGIPLH
jgi:hypothetical protein